MDILVILVSGLLGFILGAIAVALVEYRGAESRGIEGNGNQDTRLAYHACSRPGISARS